MSGRRGHIGFILATASLVASFAWAQSPPSGLHQVDDHWTVWDPPTSFPEGSEVYLIQTGDTLWDLSNQFLGDPHLWPQIWELNQYILDAHWIYPGDPLEMPGATSDVMGEFAAPPLDDGETGDPFADALAELGLEPDKVEAPVPLGHESDIYCSGFVASGEQDFPFAISGSEYQFLNPRLDGTSSATEGRVFAGGNQTQKYGLGTGDIIYLKGGRADGLGPGDLLTAIHPDREIQHPVTKKSYGQYYRYLGRVRVLSSQEDTSIAEIIMSCDPMFIGSQLQRFEPEPVPLRRITPLRPVNLPASHEDLEGNPTILGARDNLVTFGTGHLVFVDTGMSQGVAPGDIFTIYRRTQEGYPNVVLGEVGILTVFEDTSLARVLRSRYSLFAGDVLEPK